MPQQKKSIYKFIICIAFLFGADRLVGITMNYCVNHLKSGNVYELKYKLFQAKPAIVILGSSRANHHYNTAVIQNSLGLKTMNYGQDGSDVFVHYIILKTLLRTAIPKMVILDIKPGEFGDVPNFNQAATLYPIIDKVAISNDELKEISRYEKIKLMLYSYRFNNQLIETFAATRGRTTDTATISGFLPLPVKKNIFQRVNFTDNNFNADVLKYMYAIINLCKSNHIKLVICTSPYYNHVVYDRSLAETQMICKQNNIQYINYINSPMFTFHDNIFSDEAHLNSDGADIFTKDFITRIK